MTPGDLSDYADFVGAFVSDARAAKAAGTSATDFVAGWQVPGTFMGYAKGAEERLAVYVQDIYDAIP